MKLKMAAFFCVVLAIMVPAFGAQKALTPREICEKFIASVKAGELGNVPDAARAKVLEMWAAQEKAAKVDPGFIDDALRLIELDYGRAVLRINADRLEEAWAILEKLAEKPGNPFMEAAVAFQTARLAVRERNWETACKNVEKLRGSGRLADFVLAKTEIEVMTAQAYAWLARIDEAIGIARAIADTEEGRRLLARIEAERDGATLDDVAGTMGEVKKKLEKVDTGGETKMKEDKIVAMIDMLIEKAEEEEKGGQQQPGSGQGQGKPGEGEGKKGPPKGTQASKSPATQAALPPGQNEGSGVAASTATMGDFWAKLPPRERQKVLDALRERFPKRYRELIEAYYKALAEGDEK